MTIEKLERYSDVLGCGILPDGRGRYVLYSAARAREDVLLEALKDTCFLVEPEPEEWLNKDAYLYALKTYQHARATIKAIEETR
jgi:hypothetical protein